jgi:ABC-type phosphate transport system substrate-binding protein
MIRSTFSRLLVVAGLAAGLSLAVPAVPVAGQSPADVAVVVNRDVPVDGLTRAELRRILLGDQTFWSSGARVALFVRAPVAHERDAVVKTICEMTEAQFRQHWIAKVFRAETGSGPRIVYSASMALDEAGRTPGAITFIEAPVTSTDVKVLKIDGKLPGQPGYAVR